MNDYGTNIILTYVVVNWVILSHIQFWFLIHSVKLKIMHPQKMQQLKKRSLHRKTYENTCNFTSSASFEYFQYKSNLKMVQNCYDRDGPRYWICIKTYPVSATAVFGHLMFDSYFWPSEPVGHSGNPESGSLMAMLTTHWIVPEMFKSNDLEFTRKI